MHVQAFATESEESDFKERLTVLLELRDPQEQGEMILHNLGVLSTYRATC